MQDSVNKHGPSEAEHLLSEDEDQDSMEMADMTPETSRDKNATRVETRYTDNTHNVQSSRVQSSGVDEDTAPINNGVRQIEYKAHKMRWFGLGQLVLLNIVVSWDVSDVRGHTSPLC